MAMGTWKDLRGRIGGLGAYLVARHWMSTLDYQAMLYDPSVDPVMPEFRPPVIFALWHEYLVCPFYLRPHCRIAMLISRHRDAEWLSEAARHMGFSTVRGSTNRGGDAAIRQLVRASRTSCLAITPDGPRGPRHQVAPGCVFLSSRLNAPLVPVGVGYDRPWRLPTWDRFAVPRPYSRARVVVGPRVQVPPGLDRDGLEVYRRRVESMVKELTDDAEAWAASGERRRGQVAYRSQPLRKIA
jgi:lysophospholipid acyltransferase (LPLAT)-like uncharacterized protein